MNIFLILFLGLGSVITAVELYGVARRPGGRSGGGDTISEGYWFLRRRFGWKVHAPFLAFVTWLVWHFLFQGPA